MSRHVVFALSALMLFSIAIPAVGKQAPVRPLLQERLSKLITTPPDVIQFAKDRKYEQAWILNQSSRKPSLREQRSYVDREKFDVLIVEYVWNSKDDSKRFVLTFFQDKTTKMRDPKEFVSFCLNLFYAKPRFMTLVHRMDTGIVGKPYLFRQPADDASIGVFNYWFSVGPVPLWKRGERLNREDIRKRLRSRPEVEKSELNYQALLFRFNTDGRYDGPYYGFKTPCCNKRGNVWAVDYPTVDRWMNIMTRPQ